MIYFLPTLAAGQTVLTATQPTSLMLYSISSFLLLLLLLSFRYTAGHKQHGPQASCGQPFWRRPFSGTRRERLAGESSSICDPPPSPHVIKIQSPTTTPRHPINRQSYSIVLALKVAQCVGAMTVAHADTALLLCLHQAPPSPPPHPLSAPATRRTAAGGDEWEVGRGFIHRHFIRVHRHYRARSCLNIPFLSIHIVLLEKWSNSNGQFVLLLSRRKHGSR